MNLGVESDTGYLSNHPSLQLFQSIQSILLCFLYVKQSKDMQGVPLQRPYMMEWERLSIISILDFWCYWTSFPQWLLIFIDMCTYKSEQFVKRALPIFPGFTESLLLEIGIEYVRRMLRRGYSDSHIVCFCEVLLVRYQK